MTPSLYTKECGVVIDFSESWALMLTGHGITDNPNRVSWNEGWVPLRNLKKANGNICWAKKKKQTKKQKKPQKTGHWRLLCVLGYAQFSVMSNWLSETLWTVAHQATVSLGFYSGKNTGKRLPFPPTGDLSDPRIEPLSLVSPVL